MLEPVCPWPDNHFTRGLEAPTARERCVLVLYRKDLARAARRRNLDRFCPICLCSARISPTLANREPKLVLGTADDRFEAAFGDAG